MATYTNSGGTLQCVGTDITSADILSNLNSLNIGSGHTGQTQGNKDSYFFNARIRIGSTGSRGASSVWDCSDEMIKINASTFEVYGTVQQGNDNDGTSEGGGAFVVTGTSSDTFRLYDDGRFRIYGSMVYAQNRIRLGDDVQFWVIDCDFEPEDGVSPGEGGNAFGARQDIRYDRTRVHNTGGVGVKLYSFNGGGNAASFSLIAIKVEDCNHAFQVGNGDNLAPILKDVRIDSCNNHLVANLGDADVTFINPDFTQLRIASSSSADVTRIGNRYDLVVLDASGNPVQGAIVRLVDASGDVIVNNQTTDANGNVNLPTYDGDTALMASTYAGNVRTERALFQKRVASYLHNIKAETMVVDQDRSEINTVLDDLSITETNLTTVRNLTRVNNTPDLYDTAKIFLIDNYTDEDDVFLTRQGDTIDLGINDLNINETGIAYDYSSSPFNIRSTNFEGSINTNGIVRLVGDVDLSNGTYDCDIEFNQTDSNVFTNITQTAGNVLRVNASSARRLTLDGCDIDTIENTADFSDLIVVLTNGTPVPNTIGQIRIFNPMTVTVNNLEIGDIVRFFDGTVALTGTSSATATSDTFEITRDRDGSTITLVVDRAGFNPYVVEFTAVEGTTRTFTANLIQFKRSAGEVMYTNTTTPLITVDFQNTGQRQATINIGNGIVTPQQIFDVFQEALATNDGTLWTSLERTGVTHDSLPGVGNILFMQSNIRLNTTELNAGISGYIISSDGILFDDNSSPIGYVGGLNLEGIANAIWSNDTEYTGTQKGKILTDARLAARAAQQLSV